LLYAYFLAEAPRVMQLIIDLLINNHGNYQEDQFQNHFKLLVFWYTALAILKQFIYRIASELNFYIATKLEDGWIYCALKKFYELPLNWHNENDSLPSASSILEGGGSIWHCFRCVFGQELLCSFMSLFVILIHVYIHYPSFVIIFILPLPVYVYASKKMAYYTNLYDEQNSFMVKKKE